MDVTTTMSQLPGRPSRVKSQHPKRTRIRSSAKKITIMVTEASSTTHSISKLPVVVLGDGRHYDGTIQRSV